MNADVDQQCWRLAERYARQVGATDLRKIRQQNTGMPKFSITTFSMTAPCEGIFDTVTVDVTFRGRRPTKSGNPPGTKFDPRDGTVPIPTQADAPVNGEEN